MQKNLYKIGFSIKEIKEILRANPEEENIIQILNKTGWQWEKVENPIEKIISLAQQNIGKPYHLGASVSKDAPDKFDCSSFVAWLFVQAGIAIPRMSVDQYVYGESVLFADIVQGDLIFSNSGNGKVHYESVEWNKGTKIPGGIDHVGIYLGNGKIIHASKKTGTVVVEKIVESPSFKDITGAKRVSSTKGRRFVMLIPSDRLDLRIKENLIYFLFH